MFTEQIGEETGQITGIRVLPDEGHGARVEVSFQANGTLLGTHTTSMGSYTSVTRPDGSLFGEGQGVTMTDNGEMVSWKGQGVGHFTGHGTAVSYRGAVYFQTAAERLARLNSIAGIFEYDTDESGKTVDKTYEWK